ncbi:hypothetical protein [Pseudalkalibacillus hwajinpoensis]|uniref:Uncharacterized protein n=1 Tax=Guptibacillus hwajinpoensis TaxID=208199 RepID=A0A4U1MIZ7_9BACL|nr:hypothetical protein [Pseudalkalibacillus hwajinpoensis]TKD70777.1 hypothetical protein FBF83_09185 [Pseudalkalibacillus hwajinpoensis]
MDEKLKDLRSKMNETVLKEGEVSRGYKGRIYEAVIHSKKPKRKGTRFIPVLSTAACLILLLILGSYAFSNFIGTEQSLDMKESQQNLSEDNHESREKEAPIDFDKKVFQNQNHQQIYDYLKAWKLPEQNRISSEESGSSSITYENGYSFSKDTGYISSIDWGERNPEVDERPLPTENQYMGVVMGYIDEKASDIERDLFPLLLTRYHDKEVGLSWYVNVDGIKEIHNRSELLMKRMEVALKYSDELPELKNEIEKIHIKAETLANASASLEDDSEKRARELENQYEELKSSIVQLDALIDVAREDKDK